MSKKKGSLSTFADVEFEQGNAKILIHTWVAEHFGIIGGEDLLVTSKDGKLIIEKIVFKKVDESQ